MLCACLLLLAGCGVLGAESEASTPPLQIRAPRPTFTPTPAQTLASQPVTAQSPTSVEVTAQSDTAAIPLQLDAMAIVNTPLVNVRSGPGVDNAVVATVERGMELKVVGRNADRSWWNVCCVDGLAVWIIDDYVDTDGAIDSAPVTSGGAEGASLSTSAFSSDPGSGGLTSSSSQFDLKKQEQFPELGVVRLFAYIYADNEALAGYSVRVTKDGSELPVAAQSFGGQPAFTWPFQDARQRHQNLKIEFPGVSPAGIWEVQLVDDTSQVIGPPATFTLSANDPQQELYVRYEQR